ncbi:MAG: translation initiation factor IF-3, partial [Halioglobus sp.]|nr:translation initiation factor IF-3 [Halioglobus sp.]
MFYWRESIKRDNGKGASKKAIINDQITADPVRLVGADGGQVGIVRLQEAMAAAEAANMDLVLIADSDPPVCKVMDYG